MSDSRVIPQLDIVYTAKENLIQATRVPSARVAARIARATVLMTPDLPEYYAFAAGMFMECARDYSERNEEAIRNLFKDFGSHLSPARYEEAERWLADFENNPQERNVLRKKLLEIICGLIEEKSDKIRSSSIKQYEEIRGEAQKQLDGLNIKLKDRNEIIRRGIQKQLDELSPKLRDCNDRVTRGEMQKQLDELNLKLRDCDKKYMIQSGEFDNASDKVCQSDDPQNQPKRPDSNKETLSCSDRGKTTCVLYLKLIDDALKVLRNEDVTTYLNYIQQYPERYTGPLEALRKEFSRLASHYSIAWEFRGDVHFNTKHPKEDKQAAGDDVAAAFDCFRQALIQSERNEPELLLKLAHVYLRMAPIQQNSDADDGEFEIAKARWAVQTTSAFFQAVRAEKRKNNDSISPAFLREVCGLFCRVVSNVTDLSQQEGYYCDFATLLTSDPDEQASFYAKAAKSASLRKHGIYQVKSANEYQLTIDRLLTKHTEAAEALTNERVLFQSQLKGKPAENDAKDEFLQSGSIPNFISGLPVLLKTFEKERDFAIAQCTRIANNSKKIYGLLSKLFEIEFNLAAEYIRRSTSVYKQADDWKSGGGHFKSFLELISSAEFFCQAVDYPSLVKLREYLRTANIKKEDWDFLYDQLIAKAPTNNKVDLSQKDLRVVLVVGSAFLMLGESITFLRAWLGGSKQGSTKATTGVYQFSLIEKSNSGPLLSLGSLFGGGISGKEQQRQGITHVTALRDALTQEHTRDVYPKKKNDLDERCTIKDGAMVTRGTGELSSFVPPSRGSRLKNRAQSTASRSSIDDSFINPAVLFQSVERDSQSSPNILLDQARSKDEKSPSRP